MSDERMEEWYKTVEGQYAVMESVHGGLFATLAISHAGNIRVYLKALQPDHCAEYGERILDHDPLYVNGTLVKYSQQCHGEWNYFHATTAKGSEYLVEQFRTSRSVEVRTVEDISFVFSAMGFIDAYNEYTNLSDAL